MRFRLIALLSRRAAPFVAIAAALAGAVALGFAGDTRRLVVPIAAAWGLAVALAPTPTLRGRFAPILLAIAVRLPLLACAPTLSDDVFRYVWEGEVWRGGWNPFAHAPDDPVLAPLRDAIWQQVNHRAVPSVYPPVAQLLFVLLAPGGVLAWKLLSTACDVGTVALLSRRDRRAGWLWALLPLPAIESAVSGHLEGIGVLCMVAALATSGAARGAAAWLGAMIKLLPGILLVRERSLLLWGILTLAVCIPVVRPEGFGIYRDTWAYNGSLFPLAEAAFGASARPLLQVVGAGIVGAIVWRSRDAARIALWTTGTFVVLSPTVHPWYVLWPFAAALWTGVEAWTVLATLIPISYAVLASYDPATSTWTEPAWTRWVVYPPFYAALLAEGWARAVRPSAAAAH